MMKEKRDLANNSVVREFRLTTLALMNRNTVFLVILLLVVFGVVAYNTMPMELFPEINMPNIFVKTVYPGNPPIDMENLITRPLEKEIHTINGIKELRSVSTQDNSDIFIEFNTDVNIDEALQDVKDTVDKAKSELPNDLDMDLLLSHWLMEDIGRINVPPTVTVISPADGAEFSSPTPVVLRADAFDTDGTVLWVEYYLVARSSAGTTYLGCLISHDPTDNWAQNLGWSSKKYDGIWSVQAAAVDNEGAKTISPKITVTLHP